MKDKVAEIEKAHDETTTQAKKEKEKIESDLSALN